MGKAELRIDLVDLLQSTVDDRRKRVALTPIVQREVIKNEFGNRIVDIILDRTDSGIDKEGHAFKKYSKSYIKSDIFAAYNKSPSNVNLELTGAMKSDLSVTGTDRTGVTIGFKDSEQEEKALRHITGDGVPVRDFLGVPEKVQKEVLQDIIKSFSDAEEVLEVSFIETLAEIETAAAALDNNIFFTISGGGNG
jgi:hypothetical protein